MRRSGTGQADDDVSEAFSEYNQNSGQVLMTKNTIVNPVSRRNVMNTFEELFDLNVVPIVNENDTVSTYEMQFGDMIRCLLLLHQSRRLICSYCFLI